MGSNYWLGLETLYLLTNQSGNSLRMRVELESWDEKIEYSEYKDFIVGGHDTDYTIDMTYDKEDGYHTKGSNTQVDALSSVPGNPFSTTDQVNIAGKNCAMDDAGGGGWWYRMDDCAQAYPTGTYGKETDVGKPYMTWEWAFNKDKEVALKSITMKIKQL